MMVSAGLLNSRAASLDEPMIFRGTCDASAAVALSNNQFLVASDEDNILRFYSLERPGNPIQTFDARTLVSKRRKAPEADIEGSARIGNRIFLITSHGRNAQGKAAPFRHRFFALEIEGSGSGLKLRAAGRAYTNLVSDLARDARFARFGFEKAAALAPKAEGGLNIEALSDTPEGELLIGFRNPLVEGKALIIPLKNPNGIVEGEAARFGDEILVDLNGLGLRGIGSMKSGYYLLGGPIANEGECRLFRWKGEGDAAEAIPGLQLGGISPEGICFHDQSGREDFVILSDDGAKSLKGEECKRLPAGERQFRAFRIRL
jgi:hypothetical protein